MENWQTMLTIANAGDSEKVKRLENKVTQLENKLNQLSRQRSRSPRGNQQRALPAPQAQLACGKGKKGKGKGQGKAAMPKAKENNSQQSSRPARFSTILKKRPSGKEPFLYTILRCRTVLCIPEQEMFRFSMPEASRMHWLWKTGPVRRLWMFGTQSGMSRRLSTDHTEGSRARSSPVSIRASCFSRRCEVAQIYIPHPVGVSKIWA